MMGPAPTALLDGTNQSNSRRAVPCVLSGIPRQITHRRSIVPRVLLDSTALTPSDFLSVRPALPEHTIQTLHQSMKEPASSAPREPLRIAPAPQLNVRLVGLGLISWTMRPSPQHMTMKTTASCAQYSLTTPSRALTTTVTHALRLEQQEPRRVKDVTRECTGWRTNMGIHHASCAKRVRSRTIETKVRARVV